MAGYSRLTSECWRGPGADAKSSHISQEVQRTTLRVEDVGPHATWTHRDRPSLSPEAAAHGAMGRRLRRQAARVVTASGRWAVSHPISLVRYRIGLRENPQVRSPPNPRPRPVSASRAGRGQGGRIDDTPFMAISLMRSGGFVLRSRPGPRTPEYIPASRRVCGRVALCSSSFARFFHEAAFPRFSTTKALTGSVSFNYSAPTPALYS